MPSINVLSLTGQKKTAESGDSAAGKDSNTMDGTKSAAAEFAAILGGLMFPLFGSKEQISEETKAGKIEQQASPYTVTPAAVSGTLGLKLPKVLTDVMELSQNEVLQSKFPAGTDANSGLTRNQVNDSVIADLTTILKDVSSLTELAQYKETIAKLWQELSGKIETFPSRTDQIKTILAGDLQQIQQVLSGLNGSISQAVNPPRDLTAIPTGLLTDNSKTAMATPDLEGPLAGLKDTLPVQSLPDRKTDLKFEEKAQGTALDLKGQKIAELVTEAKDAAAVKREQNTGVLWQNGQSGNIEGTTPAGVKFAAVPIWEQISSFLRSQFQRSPEANKDIKEFAIQLHPAELGKIQVFLRWEDGQVHLQLRAAEQATGNILQNHLSDLRQSLQDSGVTCGLLQMGLGGEDRQTPQQDREGQTFNRAWPAEEEKAGFGEIPYSLLFEQGEQHRINFTA
jgi:flagellar hook-length control protein FliK